VARGNRVMQIIEELEKTLPADVEEPLEDTSQDN